MTAKEKVSYGHSLLVASESLVGVQGRGSR